MCVVDIMRRLVVEVAGDPKPWEAVRQGQNTRLHRKFSKLLESSRLSWNSSLTPESTPNPLAPDPKFATLIS